MKYRVASIALLVMLVAGVCLGQRKRAYYIDLDTVTKLVMVSCHTTANPNVARCEFDVHFAAVTFDSDPQQMKLDKRKIEVTEEQK